MTKHYKNNSFNQKNYEANHKRIIPLTSDPKNTQKGIPKRSLRISVLEQNESFDAHILNRMKWKNPNLPPVMKGCLTSNGLLSLKKLRNFGFASFAGTFYGTNEALYINTISNGNNLFAPEKVEIRGNTYVFIDKWAKFHCPIEEFEASGIYAEGFQSGDPPHRSEALANGYTLVKTELGTFLYHQDTKLSTLVCEDFCVVDQDPKRILMIHNNQFEWGDVDLQTGEVQNSKLISHPYGKIIKVRSSNHGNFVVIHTGEKPNDTKGRITILHGQTLEEITHIDEIKSLVYIDTFDNLHLIDSKGKIVIINTNMDHFPQGYIKQHSTISTGADEVVEIKDASKEELERILSTTAIELTHEEVAEYSGEEMSDMEKYIRQIPISDKPLYEWFNEAQTLQDLEFVQKAIDKIRALPELAKFGDLIKNIAGVISQKKNSYALEALKTSLETIKGNIPKTTTLRQWLEIHTSLEEISQARSQNRINDSEFDLQLGVTLKQVDDMIATLRQEQKQELLQEAQDAITEIGTYLDSIRYMAHLTTVYSTQSYQDFTTLTDLLDEDEKKHLTQQVQDLITKKIDTLQSEIEAQKVKKEKEIHDQKRSIVADLARLGKVLEGVTEETILEEIFEHDTLVKQIQNNIDLLDSSGKEKLLIALKQLFLERKQHIRLSQLSHKSLIGSLDEYGIDTSLYYVSDGKETSLGYELMGKKRADGTILLSLQFENGVNFDLDTYLSDPEKYAQALPFQDIESEVSLKEFLSMQKKISTWKQTGKQKLQSLISQRLQASHTEIPSLNTEISRLKSLHKTARAVELFAKVFSSKLKLAPRARLVTPNPNFIILDEEKAILESMSLGFQIQRQEQKGIDILEGPPGLGKTEICKYFAGVTNREIIRVQCSKMDPSDLFFAPQLKAGETTRQPSEWITLMQKAGTIVLFDEIDKLNPASFERLHSLFDNQRAIYDPQIGWVKANPDCLFVGTRNSYEVMSNPIVSRSFIIPLMPPSAKNEAYKISKYSHQKYFDRLSFDEFSLLYDDVLKGQIHNEATKMLVCMRSLVEVFQGLRSKQMMDGYQDRFVFEISYRDAEQIFLRFNSAQSIEAFAKKILEVLVPKARAVVYENEDKDIQEKILKEVVTQVFQSRI